MKVEIVNLKNEKAGTLELPERIFGVKWNPDLVHQAVVAQQANAREPWAHVKTRGEVRGGGKKPWKQKGTGRARHGSTRSPIWIGGGVTHGPRNEKDYSKKINKKMKQLAIFSVLSKKIKDNEIMVVDSFSSASNKTNEWAKNLKNLVDLRSKSVLVLETSNKAFAKSISNIRNIDSMSPKSLNVFDVMKNRYIIFEAKAIEEMDKHYTRIQ